MDTNEDNKLTDANEANLSPKDEHSAVSKDRRSFIGSAGLLGLGALFSETALANVREEDGNPAPKHRPVLQGMKDLRVIKQQEFDIPGGKEYDYEWEQTGLNGVTARFRSYTFRVDHGSDHYTTFTDATTHTYAAGEPPVGKTEWVTRQRVVIHGEKGHMTSDGRGRVDHLNFTTIYDDGRTYRMSRDVTVKLDSGKFNGASSFEEMLKSEAQKRNKVAKGQDDLS